MNDLTKDDIELLQACSSKEDWNEVCEMIGKSVKKGPFGSMINEDGYLINVDGYSTFQTLGEWLTLTFLSLAFVLALGVVPLILLISLLCG